jgi:hypothetical protein
MRLVPLIVAAVVLAAVAAVVVASDKEVAKSPQAEADIKTLEDAIEANNEGLLTFLRSMRVTPERRRDIAALVGRLGGKTFDEREDAAHRLADIADIARPHLEEASRGKDREVARWAQAILEQHQAGAARREAVLLAVLREVARRKVAGAGPALLEAPTVWEWPRVREAAERALAVAVRPADVEAIRKALDAPDGHVRFAAALTLLNRGDRRALAVLGELLDSPDLMVRHRACRLLRVATGQEISFAAYDPPAVRAKGAAEWRRWVKTKGTAAPLNLPAPAPMWRGKILVVSGECERAGLVELDEGGKQVWSKKYPWAGFCQGLPDGHRLVATDRAEGDKEPPPPGRVDEFDAEGKHVWSLALETGACALHRGPGGKTLVAHMVGTVVKVREYGPGKAVCWEWVPPDFPNDIQCLDGGNLLVTSSLHDRVFEVDRRGKVIWELQGLKDPRSARRIENGNTLACDNEGGMVVEVDRSKKIVWSYAVMLPRYAARLPGGDTVISTPRAVIRIDPGGKVLWEQRVRMSGHISAY